MKKLLLGLLLLAMPAWAQSPVQTWPLPVRTSNASGTIASTNVFQSIWLAASGNAIRRGCTVQNNGSNAMYVFFGPIASATTGNSVKLAAGATANCHVFDIALQDQVSITGTSGDGFYAAQQ